MTAGRGIVHSERSDPELRKRPERLAGIQAWVALPEAEEEIAPDFAHHPASTLPAIEGEGKRVRLIAGALFGSASPVKTLSELFYAEALLEAGTSLALPERYQERGAYLVEGSVEVAGDEFDAGRLLVFRRDGSITLRARSQARVMLLGGSSLGPRHIWWNFVSSRPERIERAKEDWQQGRFGRVPGDDEFIPLPESA
jgi:redox-sensitive bicupin YhaK (pirin superfamily)